jgi:hypothetical protein
MGRDGVRKVSVATRLGLLLLLGAVAVCAVAVSSQAMVGAGNGVYRVIMAQASDPTYVGNQPVGQWSAMTDSTFGSSSQNDKSILFDAAAQEAPVPVAEDELSIRSFTSDRVYEQNTNSYPGESFTLVALSSYSNTVTATANSVSDHIVITGIDSLDVTQTITVGNNGGGAATSSNSWIQVQVKVCNTGLTSVTLGVRSSWDLMVAGTDLNDKAWVSSFNPLSVGPFDANIEDVTSFAGKVAFDTRDPANTFHVYGLITDPPGSPFPDPVVAPSRFVYTRWYDSNYAWGYAASGGSIYTDPDPDSDVIYFWGGDQGTSVPAGACFEARTYITLDIGAIVVDETCDFNPDPSVCDPDPPQDPGGSSQEDPPGSETPQDGVDQQQASADSDVDGIRADHDNCQDVSNPDQADLDRDGRGDACDDDDDGDGVSDATDVCPRMVDPWQRNLDDDALGDMCDPDRDGDGWLDVDDVCPSVYDPDQADADGKLPGDACPPPSNPSPKAVALAGGISAPPPARRTDGAPPVTKGHGGLPQGLAMGLGSLAALGLVLFVILVARRRSDER